jgi:peptidyl-prolyl cis-trans isomerase SurA
MRFSAKPGRAIATTYTVKVTACLVFIFVFCLGFANAQENTNIDKVVAKVDNYIILKSDVEMTYMQMISSGEKDRGNLKCEVLENLLVNKMMLAKAEIDSVIVEDNQVDDQLERRMQYFIAQFGSREKLEEAYKKSTDQLKTELRKQVKEQMTIQKMQETITKDVKMTPSEVKKFYNAIPTDSLPYFSTEVEVAQIVRLPQISKSQKNDAREKLKAIRERIVKGEDFAALAKQYSEDPGSAKAGGELGFWGRGAMVPEYEAAALKLQPGELSPVIESPFGMHLIQLIERRGTEYNSRHILIKPASSNLDVDEAKAYLDSIRTLIINDSISFEKAAREYSEDQTTKSSGGFFTDPNTNTSRIAVENLDPVVFFVIDTMEVGQISQPLPFRTEDGKDAVRILYYKSKTPPHQANLKDDYQKIYNAALADKKNQKVNSWFEKTRGEVYVNVDKEYNHCNIHQNNF